MSGTMLGPEYRLVTEALPQLIWVTNEEGAVEYVNQQFVEYTGYRPEQLIGPTAWRKALHPDDLERCLVDWTTATANEQPFETEYRLRRARDESWRWHLTRAVPVKDDHGRVLKWIGTCTDIEDQKQIQASLRLSEERILEASRRKDEFVAMLGHELRNPLAPILGVVRLLKDRDRERCPREISIVERQALHMARLLDDLLDLGRISRGRVQLRKQRQQLATIVDHAIEATLPLVEERGHTLVVDVPRTGLAVEVDPARLSQVISNLVNNAAKYTTHGGRITVRASRVANEIVVSVTDTGIGIPADKLPHVFELFAQGDRSLDRSEGGLGIGLTVVKTLVEMHGGTVVASSDGPGRGSELVVRLPAATHADEAPSPPCAGPADEPVQPSRRRVLVVDDNADVIAVLSDFLTWKGFEVEIATDGPAALEAARRLRPDAMLLDIGLPIMDGYEVARELRADPSFATTRLIALTGYGQQSDRERAYAAGIQHHLVKPIDFAQLLSYLNAPMSAAWTPDPVRDAATTLTAR
jgi:PAS domain S-box-containing protein